LGTEGTKVALFANTSFSEPGALQDVRGKGDSLTVSLSLSHPFIRSRGRNLTATLRLTSRESSAELLGMQQFEDRLRTGSLGLSYDLADRWRGVNLLNVEVTRGFDILDATGPAEMGRSRAGGRPNFTKVTGQVVRVHQLIPQFSLFGSVLGQYAFEQLFASEEFTLGGAQFGRAYDPAEVTGDHGLALLLELQFGYTVGLPFFQSFQAYTFYDVGTVWRRVPLPGTPRSDTLASTGVGVRYNLTRGISGFVEIANPLTQEVRAEGNRNPRVFFSIAIRF